MKVVLMLLIAVALVLVANYCSATVQAVLYLGVFIALWWGFSKSQRLSNPKR
ncbi:hypothetical protein [Shewanella mangrovi]|uniref:hypothetical protein n=1 Tax=Shewanella mangrovi TaxID=1515746 RepID=UPI000B2F3897|nr:hypothetical protein [Shewanella mangrovi]